MTWNFFRKLRRSERNRPSFLRSRFRPGVEALEARELLVASPIVFTINPAEPVANRSLALSGSIGSNQLQQQGAGSLTTTYSGPIVVSYDPAASTLGFTAAGTNAVGANSGNWRPSSATPPDLDPPEPANYGGRVDLTFMGLPVRATIAVRELTASLSTTTPFTLTGGAGVFNFPSTQTMTITTGRADYVAQLLVFGIPAGVVASDSLPLAGESGANAAPTQGTFQDQGNGSYRLTVPIRFTIMDDLEGQQVLLTTAGTLVATAILPVVDLNGPAAAGADFTAAAQGGGPAVSLATTDATVTRTPTANLTNAVVTLTNRPDGAAEVLDAAVTGTSLTKAYDPATGQLTITGSAAPSVYQQVLRTVTYQNTSTSPNTANRIVQFSFSDGTNVSLTRTTTITVSGGSQTLRVSNFTATPTGFIAQFNQALNPADLNLYDINVTTTPVLGPADATLVGQSGGSVTGSLIVRPDNQTVTFIATSGVLQADTYTVTLRSAANGFKDTMGGLLDGNADGTTGDNFTRMFTVSAAEAGRRIVDLANFARGPGQPVDVPAATAGLPVSLSNGAGVTAVGLNLLYDPALLNITGFSRGAGLPTDASVTFNPTAQPGVARLDITSATGFSAGTAELIRITANIPNNAGYAAKQVLDLANVQLNGGAIEVQDDDAVHVVAYFGDVTGNARISSFDATEVLRGAVGIHTGSAAYQLADLRLLADVNGNNITGATDATRVLQEAVGINQPEIPDLPATPPTITFSGPDPFLSIPKTFKAHRGHVVKVPVTLDVSDGLQAVDLAISYDTSRLTVMIDDDVRRGDLTKDFDIFAVNVDREAGTIRIGIGRPSGPITGRGSGTVVWINFRVKPDAPAGPALINLRENLGGTVTGLNEGLLDLIPDPTNQAGDILDGLITIVGAPRIPGANVPPAQQASAPLSNNANLVTALANPANPPRVNQAVDLVLGSRGLDFGSTDFIGNLIAIPRPTTAPPVVVEPTEPPPPANLPNVLSNTPVTNTPLTNTPLANTPLTNNPLEPVVRQKNAK